MVTFVSFIGVADYLLSIESQYEYLLPFLTLATIKELLLGCVTLIILLRLGLFYRVFHLNDIFRGFSTILAMDPQYSRDNDSSENAKHCEKDGEKEYRQNY